MNVNAIAPEGATYEYMDHYMDQLIEIMKDSIPEAVGIFSVTSPGFGASSSVNSGFAGAILIEPDLRKRSQMQISDDITPVVNKFTGARTFVTQQQTIGGGRRGGLLFSL
jgi:multidrug efflux pump